MFDNKRILIAAGGTGGHINPALGTAGYIKEQNPSYKELKEWYAVSGLPLKKFFNTSGLVYKSLNLKEKLPTMTEEEQLRLLATDGMLVKRPLVVDGDVVLTGFKAEQWERLKK